MNNGTRRGGEGRQIILTRREQSRNLSFAREFANTRRLTIFTESSTETSLIIVPATKPGNGAHLNALLHPPGLR